MPSSCVPEKPATPPLENGRPMLGRHRWLWWVAWALATVFLVAFLRTFDLRAAAAQLRSARPGWIVLGVAANFLLLPLMTEQWRRLLPAGAVARWPQLWECLTVGMASMNTLPFGGGHAVTVGLLASRGVTSVSGAVSLLALEQLCEGLSKIALLLLALALAPLPLVLQRATWALAAAVVAGFVVLLWLAHHPVQNPAANGWRAKWGRHLEVLRRPGTFLYATALSFANKAALLLAIYAAQRSLGVDLPLADGPLVLAAVTFATSMSVAPGNVGLYELAAIAAYRLLGVPAGEAAALAVVLHVCFLLPSVGTGYAWTFYRALRR